MTKVLRGLFILILVGIVGLAGAGWYLAGLLMFRDKPRDVWANPEPPSCAAWMRDVAYADLRAGAQKGSSVDFPCDEALALPHDSFEARASTGMRIHYNVYAATTKVDAYAGAPAGSPARVGPPILLHIHGVSGNFLHGARYFKAAERMGFQLAAMDLSNHGLSEHDGRGAAYGCREDADVTAVIDDIKTRFPARDIYIHSTSMGAMALANVFPRLMASDATDHRIVAATLENPIPSVRDIVVKSPLTPPVPQILLSTGIALAGWRAGYNFDTCRPIDNMRFARIPLLVQWSQKDTLVPRELNDLFYASLPADVPHTLEVFPEGAHSAVWNGDPERYERETVANWREGLRYRASFSIGKIR